MLSPAGTLAPASPAQRRMWFLDQLTPGDPAYHMFLADRLRGPLDVTALRHAIDAVVARHDILRTRFPAPDGQPHQEVLPAAPVPVEHVDLTTLPDGDRERRAEELVAERTNAPFDLAAAPPVRITLLRLGAEDHVLCVVLHHMVADGWSLYVWRRELSAHYGGTPDVPELPLQYADVRHEQADSVAYWTEHLSGAPPLDLPTDHPRPSMVDSAAGVVTFRVDEPGVATLARRLRATPFMVLFAAAHTLFAHLSGQRDFCVGVPVAARDRVELEPMIGPFAGILALRPDMSGDPTFAELVKRVRKVALGGFTHRETPLEQLVDALDLPRDLSRNPLYQAVFALHTTASGYADTDLPGLTTTPFPHGCHRAKVDLALELWPQQDGMHAELTYRTDLFTHRTAEQVAERFQDLLSTVVNGPDARVATLRPDHGVTLPLPDKTVVDLVREQRPDATAVVCGDTRFSYADLVAFAERVAAGLAEDGVTAGDVVAVQLPRSAEMIGALLGIMLAGAAYLPVDPEYPAARIDYVLADSGARMAVTEEWLARLGDRRADGRPGEIAYIIYTSGSTGRPKGVVIPHRALTNLLSGMQHLLGSGPDDVWLAITSLSFDISALELFLPLVTGGQVVVADRDTVRDGGALARLALGVTHVQATPSGWRTLLDGNVDAARVAALVGGEALPLALARELRGRVARLVNMYGPTETTIWSTAWEVPTDPAHVSIGRPIANTVVSVVDGELRIGGAGLAVGYHDRPELTAERFVTDADGVRWYRTGDRVRRRPDGDLEFLGRFDDQVKVRGHRVEPGEIEAALEALPTIRRAVVVARDDRLVAYVAGSAAGAVVRLAEVLPAYLVPDTVVELAELPLTLNGKVDRKALPTPGQARSLGGPPRTEAERRVAAVFAEVLGHDTLGVDSDFFALGGHSLLATKVAARLGAIPVRLLFTHPTVAALAATLSGHADTDGPRPRGDRPAVLSPAQERLWFLHRLDPGDASYTMYLVRRLSGPLDVAAFERACTELVARHEVLRTRFPEDDGRPVAVVEPPAPVAVEHLDAAGEDEARRHAAERVNAALDLASAPPVRFTLIRLGEQDHVLCVVLHHIVADGWSLTTMLAELSTLYTGGTLSPLPVQAGDVAIWRRAQDTAESRAYWRTQLAEPPALALPVDGDGEGGAFETRHMPAEALEQVARERGATLFMLLVAAYTVLLARHTGQRDVLIGSPTAGRDRVELEPLIGYLSNTVVLRGKLAAGDSFTDLLCRTRDTVLDAMAHQDVPFEYLLGTERGTPLFQTMAVLHSQETEQHTFGDLRVEPFDSGYRQAKFDLMLEVWRQPDGLLVSFAYDTSTLAPETASALADRFMTLLAGVIAAPDARLAAVPLLTAADHARLAELAGTHRPTPASTVPDLLTTAYPERTALVCGDTEITYAQLDERVQRLAASLRRDGVAPGVIVGVCLPRSIEAVVALLAVWRAGGAYLPLDPELPPARVARLVADSNAKLVVDQDYEIQDGPLATVVARPHDPAYVIYTSGSTGEPKGVVVEHGDLAARVHWMRDAYGLSPEDRVVQFASLSFDTHAEELYPALAAGAAVVLLPGGGTELPALLAERRDITVLDLPTAYFHRLVDVDTPWPDGLRLAIIGGEQVHPAALARWGNRCRLLNTYGPTETTIVATAGELTDTVHIGQPVPGATAWVLDEHGALAPPGAPGELAIGGAGVARGYLGRPGLTAERFVADPWGPPGARLYRTGDRVRWRRDGVLEFLGRLDDQLKVRGFRIEPGEVEAALLACPGVRGAAVTAVDEVLVAYIHGTAGHDDLARRLAETLPTHLVPTRWVGVDAIPLTVQGKVDRAALPAPGMPRAAGHVPPRTDTEQLVASVWSEVLGVARVGAHDDFFALGGHSLLAVRVVARLRAAADVPVRTVFVRRTVADLAAAIEELHAETTVVIPRRPDGEAPPLSYAQERLWFLAQYAPGTTAYTIPVVRRLRRAVDPDELRAALGQAVARHEPLRTHYPAGPDGLPTAAVAAHLEPPLVLSEVDSEDAARTRVDTFLAQPFDLATGPVCRVLLARIGPEDHVLAVALHHIAGDGGSAELLLGELLTGAAPELPVRYGDYARWQRNLPLDAHIDHWRARLAGARGLDLPTDRPRPPELTYNGACHTFTIDADIASALVRLSREHGATPYMVLLAAFAVTLGRHAGQDDVVVGSPVDGRNARELEPLVGCFVNTLPMRVDLSGTSSFVDVLTRARDTALDAFTHQELPFERLVAELDVPRDPSRPPLCQVLFAFQNYQGAGFEGFGPGTWTTRFDLELYAHGDHDGLSAMVVYNTDLFDHARIERLAGHLVTVLAAGNPPLAELEILTAAELSDRLRWNDTAADLGTPECLHVPVTRQAARTPDRVAVSHPGGDLTYASVELRARALASRLVAAGVRRGDLVAVVMERGWEQVVAVLAINKAGAAYLPIDADLPAQRRAQLIELGGCQVVVTQPWLDSDGLAVDDTESDTDVACPATPSDLAYVIFTSGSTGTPKGVMIEHRAALNTVRNVNQRFGIGEDDLLLSLSALSFDLSVQDVYGGLATGATLVMPAPSEEKDPAAWARLVARHRVTVWNSVPALMELLVEQVETEGGDLSSLRLVLLSGDWIPLTLPDRIRALAPEAQVISLGGATEGSIWSIWYPVGDVDPAWSSIPYGRPMANQTFHVLDDHLRAVPVGVPGHLYIGGAGVATGYWRDEERTRAAFVTHRGERLYRTGDLGRYRADGVIEFLGRADDQVKIRGYRVELGEIEAVLRTHPDVTDCVVTIHDGGLVAYVVGDPAAVRAHLSDRLPAYMVPNAVVPLESLPLTANGKVDRARLPAPEPVAAQRSTAPETPTERVVAAVWADVLDGVSPGLDDDFFGLGGHSLLAIKAVTRLRRELGRPVAVMDLFKHPTARGLAALLDRDGEPDRGLLHELTPARATVTTSYVCVPYGGGSAVVYQPLADALPADCALWSVAIPGHDVGLGEDRLPFDEVAARCAEEILAKVRGPLVLYGHCGVGSALTVDIARRLEAAGRVVDAVYIGAVFPFGRPGGKRLSRAARLEFLRGDRTYANWLTSMGVDMADLEPAQAKRIIQNMRRDTDAAEEFFTALFEHSVSRLSAPVIAVAGDRDPATEYYQERFREWHFLTDTAAVVVLEEAGHFFLRYRAPELAAIVTRTHRAIAANEEPKTGEHWRLHEVSRSTSPVAPAGPRPSMRRFLAVAVGQLLSITGSALTQFALPLWIYLTTGSLAQFALFAVVGLVPGLLAAPLAGAVVDRTSRRTVMLWGDVAAGGTQLVLGILLWTDNLAVWHIYPLLALLSVALAFQRVAYVSAVPQLVPKRYLGHANGIVQLAGGMAQLVVPLAAVGLMTAIGLEGVLLIDVVSYTLAIAVTLAVRFPATMAWRRREPVLTEIKAGFAYSLRHPAFRRMLLFFACLNVFLSPLFLMLSPLVLAFATLPDVGTVSFVGGLGVLLGGIAMTAWGGPRRLRMRAVLLCTLALAAFCVVTGLRADLTVIAIGAFGMSLWLTLLNGIYATIVQVKVPQRFHGRVFALNTLIAWSTLPIGFGLVAPYGGTLLEPLLADGGALASTVGAAIGTGPGRGIGLLYLLLAAGIVVVAVLALRGSLSHFDDEVPDAPPDDLVGLESLTAAHRR